MIWSYLKNTNKPILLYGMGNGAEKILDRLISLGITPNGVFASDGFARHNIFRGYTVISYSEAREKYGDFIALIAFGSQREDVLSLFRKMQDEVELYAPDVPVYGDNIFDKDFYEKNRSRLDCIYSRLADDKSKKVFENTVQYKLSGKIGCLFDCETAPREAFEDIIMPQPGDGFLDLGAYVGDTVEEYISHNPDYGRIIAVEPDRKTFKKLQGNAASLRDIQLLNVGISDKTQMLPFALNGGRNTSKGVGEEILCRSVDDILLGSKIDYIKADVEGCEHDAIIGARRTILQHKPKLCISAYHRSEDIFALPEDVFAIRDDYKIYMRHFPYVPAWDTNYYFI